jgi:hypothetical protein
VSDAGADSIWQRSNLRGSNRKTSFRRSRADSACWSWRNLSAGDQGRFRREAKRPRTLELMICRNSKEELTGPALSIAGEYQLMAIQRWQATAHWQRKAWASLSAFATTFRALICSWAWPLFAPDRNGRRPAVRQRSCGRRGRVHELVYRQRCPEPVQLGRTREDASFASRRRALSRRA